MKNQASTLLIVFSGLPGTGKTTLSRELATCIGAVYLRIDSIEQAIREAGVLRDDVGSSGYRVAGGIARANLDLGRDVIVDCVNPVAESRRAWAAMAREAGAALVDIQVLCSDVAEHRRRVEARQGDIPGLTPPDWPAVLRHEFEPWSEPPFTLDTARLSVADALSAIVTHLLDAG